MNYHVGVDILELKRIRSARFPHRISEYVLTDIEREEMRREPNPIQFLASRFAAKEAVIKACPERLTYQDFAIVKEGRKPRVELKKEKKYEISVSLSHSTDYVAGFACCQSL